MRYTGCSFRKRGKIMELKQGRPSDCTGRLDKEIRCYDLLDSLGIDYVTVDHDAAMTMEACIAVDHALGAAMCKNLLLCNRQQTDFYLLMLPGDKVFKTSQLSKQIGSSRLSFAQSEPMEQYLNITPGSLSVLGLMNDREHHVQLLIDEELLQSQFIGCHPCINTSSLRLSVADLMQTLLPALHHQPIIVKL